MKVLIVSPCILPVPAVKGGAVLTLIESLIRQNEISHKMELTVIGSYDEEAYKKSLEYPTTEFIFLNYSSRVKSMDNVLDHAVGKIRHSKKSHKYLRKLQIVAAVKKVLLKNDYDRVVFQNSGFLLETLKDKKIGEKYKGKLYYHLHNDIPSSVYVNGAKDCTMLLVSQYLQKKVDQLCKCDMSSSVKVVKNGFDVSRFNKHISDEEKLKLRHKIGIADDKRIVLYTGRIVEYKGIGHLIDAFIKSNRQDAVLLIVGAYNFGSGETSEFEQRIREKVKLLKDRVFFTGYVPYNDISKYYQLADVAVLASTWQEPAGLTMIETLASGTPLITTQSGGIPEYISQEQAILLENNDKLTEQIEEAMNEILDHTSCWKEKTEAAQEYVCSHYSEECYYNAFVDALI